MNKTKIKLEFIVASLKELLSVYRSFIGNDRDPCDLVYNVVIAQIERILQEVEDV